MNLDDFQKSWQSQDVQSRITINADVLLNEVRRNQRKFRRTIFWRDVREVGVAALLVPLFIYGGWQVHWTLYLCAFGCFTVGAYILFDRWRQKGRSPGRGQGSLKECTTDALADVRHQIWLLKNVLWWYLLPLFVPMLPFFAWVWWIVPAPIAAKIQHLFSSFGFVVLVFAGIYWLNQLVVRKNLEPRRRELENLLAEFEPENRSSIMKTKKPFGPLLLVIVVSATAIAAEPFMNTNPPMTKFSPTNTNTDTTAGAGFEMIRKKYNLPALAVVVTKDGQICDRVAVGVRKWGDPTPVTTNDEFHIGSCTKSMTATLAAILIDEGKLRWDTTIAEVFPELKGKMDKEYEAVTVEELLHQRGGVPADPPPAAWKRALLELGTPMQQRREFIEAVLREPPAAAPGTKMIYSNQGYTIVGAMLEKITGQDFETLMTDKLFKPLHMDTAGFGPPGTPGKVDQPWGHRRLLLTFPLQADNPPAIDPAGRVHCSLDDLARYAMFHMRKPEANGLLKPETFARLHAPPQGAVAGPLENYACGWVILKRDWGGGNVLWHNGSNTMWYIVMWLAPEKNFSVIVATNIAGSGAEQGCDDAAVEMIQKWLGK